MKNTSAGPLTLPTIEPRLPPPLTSLIYIFIYLLYENLLPPQRDRHVPTPRKERRRKEQGSENMEEKNDRDTEGETPPQSRQLMNSKERKNRRENRRGNKETGSGSVTSYDPQRSYSCNSLGPQGYLYTYNKYLVHQKIINWVEDSSELREGCNSLINIDSTIRRRWGGG